MAVYTLYPQSAGGMSKTFRAFDLASDDAATELAEKLLHEHASAESIAIWQDDTFVGIVRTQAANRRDRVEGSPGPQAES